MKDTVTIQKLQKMKEAGQRICMVTAYDATFARIFDNAGADAILVGDSLGMVIQGHSTTLPVTMDQMVYHCQAVTRGAQRAHVIGDLPFMSYQGNLDEAVRNAGRLVSEGGVAAVKLEGGSEFVDVISRIVRASIPVMGHLGLTPQSVHKMGGYLVQGRDDVAARRILQDALDLEAAGCYSLVLEGIPLELAKVITRRLRIPTIGIGAGGYCDGQVLVCYDLLGLNPTFKPKFVKHFANGYDAVRGAAEEYFSEVRAGLFPAEEHSFHSSSMRLVTPKAVGEPEERTGIYGVPV